MDNHLQINQNAEQTYHSIRQSIVSAQHKLSAAVNYAMVITYWEIGEQIYKACGENDRAAYGKNLLDYLSAQLTAEFGKGFDKSNLRKMRQFYCTFPIRDTLCLELSWSHYRLLYGGMCKVCMERPTVRTADQHNVLSENFSKPGQSSCFKRNSNNRT